MVTLERTIRDLAERSGVDWDALLDANERMDAELRAMGMQGEHPHLHALLPGEHFDADGMLRDANGKPREVMYAVGGRRVFFPIRRASDIPKTSMSKEDFGRWCHDVRKLCFRRYTFYENVTFSGYLDADTDEDAVRACMSYCADFPALSKAGQGLLLYGKCGTGKTHLAACVCNEVIGQGYRPLMLNPNVLSDEGCRKWGGFTPMLEELATHNDLLVLDDIGRESSSGWMQGRVFEAVDYFYRNRVPLVVTTNYTADFIRRPTGEHSKPIIDRLKERCNRVEVAGPNRRQLHTARQR